MDWNNKNWFKRIPLCVIKGIWCFMSAAMLWVIKVVIPSGDNCLNCPGWVSSECDKYLFLTKYKYQVLFSFQKSPNTEYWILFGVEKIQIPTIEYYSVLRKSEHQIRMLLFRLTIWVPNTEYQKVKLFLEKSN